MSLTLALSSNALRESGLRTPRVRYRADIDGLRAVAVLAVVLFHAKIGPFTGGFVGVDVFFVISGYLITQLITRDLEDYRFSLTRFYERRIRRLFPALVVMLVGASVAAYLLFLPLDFRTFGKNLAGATLFVSNVVFWKQTNYFDGPAELKPLVHTWSLAVEEQFYIVFPVLLVWLLRFRNDKAVPVLAGIAVASFLLSVLAVAFDPASAFYLAPFRFWELLVGALLALGAVPSLASNRARSLAACAGLAAILLACTAYSALTPFPGLGALLPCAGAALIIHSGEAASGTAAHRLLSTRPAVFVGAISYSLYLWHWPVIVFARYYRIEKLPLVQSAALVIASAAVAALSWRFIELPFRYPREDRPRSRFLQGIAATMACVALSGILVYGAAGLPERFSPQIDDISSYSLSMNPNSDRCGDTDLQLLPDSPCTIGAPGASSMFLWGDSHAGALYGALQEIAKSGLSTTYAATPRCPPLIGVGTSSKCIAANSRKLDFVLSHSRIRTVILAARWSLYLNGRAVENGPAETNGNLPVLHLADGSELERFSPEAREAFRDGLDQLVRRLLVAGKTVVLVYPIPETGYDIPSAAAKMTNRGEDPATLTTPVSAYHERQRFAFTILDGLGNDPHLRRVRPDEVLCHGARCLTTLDSKPLYFDSHHLSIPGAQLLVAQLSKAITDPANARAHSADSLH